MSLEWTEWLGYVASLVVAVSLTMTNIRRLRLINLMGAIAFTVYGVVLHLYPVMIVNGFIIGINIYYLIRISLTREQFHLIPISWDTSIFLPRFIEFYIRDIRKHFPDLDIEALRLYRTIFITRNVVPVGLFIYEHQEHGIIRIQLDYEIPMYRDYESARYFFREFRGLMQKKGFHTDIPYSNTPLHQRYLRRMKFTEDPTEPGRFIRKM
ncbi:MAG: hypothetical protein L3J79_04550 [Candidatus Marinimicrobia bacterium]|nr:hypothetical protein [Candidatus Neomarinimicrobiota bacterium]